jgi:Na+/H+-translocating membrane pyrophosphatase
VSLALFGSFVTASSLRPEETTLLDNRVYVGLLIGAMLPYWFSALTMKSVGVAALAMVEEVRRQFRELPGILEGTTKPDYKRCVQVSDQCSVCRATY